MTEFVATRDELKFLIRDRDSDSLSRIKSVGGVVGIAGKLNVDVVTGLSGEASNLASRAELFGANFVPPPRPRSYLSFLMDAFGDLTIIILCVSAVVDLGIAVGYSKTTSSYAESAAILVSIFAVTNVAAVNDYRKQNQFRKLNAVADNVSIIAIRGGAKVSVLVSEIVVGDVVTLSIGDIVCADGLLVEGHGIEMDESSLTGEPKSIKKSCGENPFLLSGTKVMEGAGSFLVIAVGESSEAGQIRMIVQGGIRLPPSSTTAKPTLPTIPEQPEEAEKFEENLAAGGEAEVGEAGEVRSVLTCKLDTLAATIGKVGTLVATVCFFIMVLRFSITKFALTDPVGQCAVIGASTCSSQSVIDLNPSGGPWLACPTLVPGQCCLDSPEGAIILGSPCPWLKVHIGEFIGFFITAVTILVVAVPEGLPLAVTLALAFSVIKMQVDKNLVKHLDACETMGSATTVCSDKTGTLTKNRMTVMRALVGGDGFKPNGQMPVGLSVLGFVEADWLEFEHDATTGRKRIPKFAVRGFSVSGPVVELLGEAISVNSTADIQWDPVTRLWDQLGNKTECALLQFAADLGVEYAPVREHAKAYLVKALPFNSAKKRSTVVLKSWTSLESSFRVHVKGASETVLESCTSMMTKAGEVRQLSGEDVERIRGKIAEYASHAMRTICLAMREVPTALDWEDVDALESGLTLLAIVGIEDPVRDEVPQAILKCRQAGVDVRMVTGDNIDTAVAIAKQCGILRPVDLDEFGDPKKDAALTGPAFRKRVLLANGEIDQAEFDRLWPTLRVLARSSPTDKFTLVTGLRRSELCSTPNAASLGIHLHKQVVAVTGDGTNDAPALKKADVGFAMGITGTAVAKDAADIILMDDNFSSIVKAIMWGRNVHEGIAKFLQFQLTVNVVALVLAIEGSLAYSESPLKAVQMLWVNLIMDSLASLALATELPTEEHLKRPPIGRDQSIISGVMIWNILGHVLYQLTVLNALMFASEPLLGVANHLDQGDTAEGSDHNTLIFNTFVLMQLFNQINSRKLHHEWSIFSELFQSPLMLGILLVEIGTQILIIEFGSAWFHVKPLSGKLWLVGILLALLVFPVQWMIVGIATLFKRTPSTRAAMREPLKAQEQLKVPDTAVVVVAPPSSRSEGGLGNISSRSAPGLDALTGGLVMTKRHETSTTMAKALSKHGDEEGKRELTRAGIEYTNKRRSISAAELHQK